MLFGLIACLATETELRGFYSQQDGARTVPCHDGIARFGRYIVLDCFLSLPWKKEERKSFLVFFLTAKKLSPYEDVITLKMRYVETGGMGLITIAKKNVVFPLLDCVTSSANWIHFPVFSLYKVNRILLSLLWGRFLMYSRRCVSVFSRRFHSRFLSLPLVALDSKIFSNETFK